MRNQCLRLVLFRCRTQSQSNVSQVHLRSLTSLIHPRAPHVTPEPYGIPRFFTSTSEVAVERPKLPAIDQAVLLADIFRTKGSKDEIKLNLDSNNIVITHDLILSILRDPNTSLEDARMIFDWISVEQNEKLSSKSYNFMLGILGSNGLVKDTWDMIAVMKGKGYGVHKGTFVRILEKFEKEGFADDVEKLKELYATGSAGIKINDPSDNAIENACARISEMIRDEVWGDKLEKQLRNLDAVFSSDMVSMVLKNLEMEPNKALIFFRWLEESNLFMHTQQSYNVMTVVLGKADSTEKFWKFVLEMSGKGIEMERETYLKILNWFVHKKMIRDAVEFYTHAMKCKNKPPVSDCTFLLKKVVVSEELDIECFRTVVKYFQASGNELTDAHLDAVLKSLTSVGRMTDCNRILTRMRRAGYKPSGQSLRKIAFKLSSGGNTDEALEFRESMAACHTLDCGIWESLIKGYCAVSNLDKAHGTFLEMVESEGAPRAGYALNMLVRTYCRKNRPVDAYKLVSEMLENKGLCPWNNTYKELISKLLVHKKLDEALDVMKMKKAQGYEPEIDSFVKYLSKTGSTEEAVTFSQTMTSKRSVYLRLFEAYFKAGRKNEAQDFLLKCPGFIKNHANVLNLFCSMESQDVAKTAAVAV